MELECKTVKIQTDAKRAKSVSSGPSNFLDYSSAVTYFQSPHNHKMISNSK